MGRIPRKRRRSKVKYNDKVSGWTKRSEKNSLQQQIYGKANILKDYTFYSEFNSYFLLIFFQDVISTFHSFSDWHYWGTIQNGIGYEVIIIIINHCNWCQGGLKGLLSLDLLKTLPFILLFLNNRHKDMIIRVLRKPKN